MVRNYHADNGTFADNAFISDVKHKSQGISYCGVNAHHQNGKAEKRIRGFPGPCKSADNTSMPQMAWSDITAPMAIHNMSSKWSKKLLTLHHKWDVTNHIVCQNQGYPKNFTSTHFWVPSICTSEWAPSKAKNRQMETKMQSRHIPGTITIPCRQCAPDYVSSHWSCVTIVPCHIRWLLWNNQANGKTHPIWLAFEGQNIPSAKICFILWRSIEWKIQPDWNIKPATHPWNHSRATR